MLILRMLGSGCLNKDDVHGPVSTPKPGQWNRYAPFPPHKFHSERIYRFYFKSS